MKKLTRDETEHGQHYYLASEVDAALSRLPAPLPTQPAQLAQEPVDNDFFKSLAKKNPSPDQRPWVGLTDTEKHELRYSHMTSAEFIDAIEAKLKEKNT